MSELRTVVVPTIDHGTVRFTEPVWCLGNHPAGGYREDIQHQGAEVPLLLDTICHGQVQTLAASLMQRPFSTHGTTRPVVTIETDGDHEFNAASLRDVVDALVIYGLGRLKALARQLEALEEGGES
ncbi:hypothetical protein GTY65_19855 [Streptomyces sp. SID8379]|uniref:DUF6907 domain-containing protein n=1 Tax=unclassified Streptomyces TaxID=2593676 RepID=UPI000362A467|nr:MULTISPECIES: hypothetical protein [unclassified Streptomyces]MYW66290.1 hypothetical protein [Streptomyces sp. SID8379]